MSTIITRAGKGSPLTNNQVDANFVNLNTDKLETGSLSVTTNSAGNAGLAYASNVFTYTPPNLSVYAALSGAIFTGDIELKNGGTRSTVKFYCESNNAHYAELQAPPHSAFSGNVTLTLPASTDTLVGIAATQTLSNKTLTGATFTGALVTNSTVDGRDVATDGTKLDGIEASADVTDTANVTSSGALMDSEISNLAQVKAFSSSDYATAAQGSTADSALQTGDKVAVGIASIVTSSSVTATVNKHFYVSAAGQTITLPASPTIGQRVLITVGNFTNTVVARNGSKIMSLTANMTLDKAYLSIQFIYTDATQGWIMT